MKIFKKLAAGLITFSILFCVAALSGCSEDYLPEYESGYYRYAVRTEKDGTEKAYLIGLTELGEQQKVLVYPEYIDGIKVYGIYYEHYKAFGSESIGDFKSDKLEKFFFPQAPEERTTGNPKLSFANAYAFFWDVENDRNEPNFRKGVIYGFNYYSKFVGVYGSSLLSDYIANVSYIYNYDNAENDGYYWVDSYDEDIITFIPPEPEREGYLFDGWYKESECINKWDFGTDVTGRAMLIEAGVRYETYEGIYLYAKWVKNS